MGNSRPERRGAFYGLAAAALFGLSAPIAKLLLASVSAQVLAGLLYLGAGFALSGWRALRPASQEARLQRSDLPALVAVVASGGVIGPLLLLFGLQRVGAVTGSLLLNLEAPFTIALAVLFFREHLGRATAAAAALILGGAAFLKLQPGTHAPDGLGMAAIAGACLSWALDNNLTQRLSLRDPLAIVRIKALGAGGFNLVLGLALGNSMPAPATITAALLLGAVSYGASVVLDAHALRLVGAAREAAYFASAPFAGAIASTLIVGERLGWLDLAAMASMATGVVLLLRERHSHLHEHLPIEHDHLHSHDAHHQHAHATGDPPGEPHAHAHRHAPLIHDHPHVPDAHHRHRHDS